MWCIGQYEYKHLSEYFCEEHEIEAMRYRLINTRSVEKEAIVDHIKMFKDDIKAEKYQIFSTTHSDYEIIICYKDSKQKDVIAIQLFPDPAERRVALAIYSYDRDFVNVMNIRYRDLQVQGIRFRIGDFDMEKSIDEWINHAAGRID